MSVVVAPQAAAPVHELGLAAPRRWIAVFAVLASMALVVLDAGIVNVALPALGSALGASPATSVLVVTAYQAGVIMTLLPSGALGERFGHRRVFTAGVAVFAVSSALCALSPTWEWLVAARWLQGSGGGAVMSLGVALLRFTVPKGRLGAAIGWNALTVALASAAAPSLGAAVLSIASWQVLFSISLPPAGAALWAARSLPETPRTTEPQDAASMVLNALAFGLVILAAELWETAPGLAASALGAGLVALVLLVRREAPKAAPLLPLDLLRFQPFRLSVIASVCCFSAQSAGLLALAFLLQDGFDFSPTLAGLYLTVWPASVAVTALVAGRLADRIPTAWLCAMGGTLLAAGLAGAATCRPGGQAWLLVPFTGLAGMGFGMFQSPNNRNMFLSAPPERGGAAGGAQGSARVTGQTLGALLMSTLFGMWRDDGALDGGRSGALRGRGELRPRDWASHCDLNQSVGNAPLGSRKIWASRGAGFGAQRASRGSAGAGAGHHAPAAAGDQAAAALQSGARGLCRGRAGAQSAVAARRARRRAPARRGRRARRSDRRRGGERCDRGRRPGRQPRRSLSRRAGDGRFA
jgi:DHA2 family multidrug resistance protein-like MFS transporter